MATNPTSATAAAPPPLLPHIHLLCMQPSASTAFAQALVATHAASAPPSTPPLSSHLRYTVHNTYLSDLPDTLRFDLAVSPANSYGILDGGFDDALSRALGPRDDYGALTRAAQRALYRRHGGYLPPGGCCVARIPVEQFRGRLRYRSESGEGSASGSAWGCRYLALCPTMRVPSPCGWDRDVVYECIWSLLNAIGQHNDGIAARRTTTDDDDDGAGGGGEGDGGGGGERAGGGEGEEPAPSRIESILMTPLGTGTGGLSDDKWAKQAVLAMKHWVEAKQNPQKWSAMNWKDAGVVDNELRVTHSA